MRQTRRRLIEEFQTGHSRALLQNPFGGVTECGLLPGALPPCCSRPAKHSSDNDLTCAGSQRALLLLGPPLQLEQHQHLAASWSMEQLGGCWRPRSRSHSTESESLHAALRPIKPTALW